MKNIVRTLEDHEYLEIYPMETKDVEPYKMAIISEIIDEKTK